MSYTFHPIEKKTAAIAVILTLPIALLFLSFEFEITWIEKALKSVLTDDGDMPNTFGMIFMVGGLIALPIALAISLWPMIRKNTNKHVYIINVLIAVAIIALITPMWGGIIKDFINCDILQIPNCD